MQKSLKHNCGFHNQIGHMQHTMPSEVAGNDPARGEREVVKEALTTKDKLMRVKKK